MLIREYQQLRRSFTGISGEGQKEINLLATCMIVDVHEMELRGEKRITVTEGAVSAGKFKCVFYSVRDE